MWCLLSRMGKFSVNKVERKNGVAPAFTKRSYLYVKQLGYHFFIMFLVLAQAFFLLINCVSVYQAWENISCCDGTSNRWLFMNFFEDKNIMLATKL